MGKANIGLIFLNYDTSTSLPPMGRLLVLGVDEKGGCLCCVISESILLKRAFQIATVSLSCSLICASLCSKNSVPFPKTSIVQKKRRTHLALEWPGFDSCNWLAVWTWANYLIFLNLSFFVYEVKLIPTCFVTILLWLNKNESAQQQGLKCKCYGSGDFYAP